MTSPYTHQTLAQRVTFACGEASHAVADEVHRLGAEQLMVIASAEEAGLASRVTTGLPVALWHHDVVMHVPTGVAVRAREAAAAHSVDAIVCLGGGSATGLAKAVALTTGLPIIAVPTTYAGSEATNVWGLTEDEVKTTGMDDRVLPRSIVYDATLLVSLPGAMTVASGLNAMAHCIDAMWGPRVDPLDRALAGEGLRGLATGLPMVTADAASLDGIEQTLYGAYLAAVAFTSAGSGLHHKICHVLGGMFDLPHAQTHAVVLPHVLAFNAPNAADAERRIATALGSPTAVSGLQALRAVVGAPRALRDFGMPEEGIDRAVAPILAAAPASNPTPVTEQSIAALLRAAWEGSEPR